MAATALGSISLLDESDIRLQKYALELINKSVSDSWFELAEHVDQLKSFYERENFPYKNLVSLVISKIYYHTNDIDQSLKFALGANDLFNIAEKSHYVRTITSKCVDEYVMQCTAGEQGKEHPRLRTIFEQMFDNSLSMNEFSTAVGIALDARRIDLLEKVVLLSKEDPKALLREAFSRAIKYVFHRDFRHKAYRKLVELHKLQEDPDSYAIVGCLVRLNEPHQVGSMLVELAGMNDDKKLEALQISLDLCENVSQAFLQGVRTVVNDACEKSVDGMVEDADVSNPTEVAEQESVPENKEVDVLNDTLRSLKVVLLGERTLDLNLHFLFSHCSADARILTRLRSASEASRSSIVHTATVFANSLMYAGTTSDTFLRNNLEWLGKAQNWAKFSVTSSLGVIHRGHIYKSRKVLDSYLPHDTNRASRSPYSEGGALFALGLIHANHGGDQVDQLMKDLSAARGIAGNEPVEHGACLGLGLAALATGREDVYELLKDVMFSDNAVSGEAAAIGMGLAMCGTADAVAMEEMLAYAKETQHEKIMRGVALGAPLIMYGREEEADHLISELEKEQDPILRSAGAWVTAFAYAGTANNGAVEKLLHWAVSDVSDVVRRAAVTAIGFLLFRDPAECPKMVALLAESYNPSVRYGAALAVGLSCAGTGLEEAKEVLEPLSKDSVSFVRQGTYIAKGLLMIQQTAKDLEKTRDELLKVAVDKYEDVMTRLGATIGLGILSAGGGNVTVSLKSSAGLNNMTAIVGAALFTHYWNWHPMIHMLSLAMSPTALMGVTHDLKVPNCSFISDAAASAFGLPKPLEVEKKKGPERGPKAVLSIGRRSRLRKNRAESMDVETEKEPKAATVSEMETEEGAKAKPTGPKQVILQNPARVTVPQQKVIRFSLNERYQPIHQSKKFGLMVMRDMHPELPEDLVDMAKVKTETVADAPKSKEAETKEAEPSVPDSFEYDTDKDV